MSYREEGKNALSTILKQEQNIRIIEKHIYDTSKKECVDEEYIEEIYRQNLYQTIGDILDGNKLSNMVLEIKNSRLGWNHFTFKDMQNMLDEQNDFIENPFAVEEGVLECKSRDKDGVLCGSKRVFSYQRQVRSADEPMTTFASCCKCGTKWQYSG
jgi:DNA-directed RNA polymerase subunit M/transcription elongation factor TFIIS